MYRTIFLFEPCFLVCLVNEVHGEMVLHHINQLRRSLPQGKPWYEFNLTFLGVASLML